MSRPGITHDSGGRSATSDPYIGDKRLPLGKTGRLKSARDTFSQQLTLLALFVVTILLAQGCSMSKPPSLEEAGTPPQSSMESEVPQEEPAGQYSINVTSDKPLKAKQPVLLKISITTAKNAAPPTIKEKQSCLVVVSKDGSDFQRLPLKETSAGKLECSTTFSHDGT